VAQTSQTFDLKYADGSLSHTHSLSHTQHTHTQHTHTHRQTDRQTERAARVERLRDTWRDSSDRSEGLGEVDSS